MPQVTKAELHCFVLGGVGSFATVDTVPHQVPVSCTWLIIQGPAGISQAAGSVYPCSLSSTACWLVPGMELVASTDSSLERCWQVISFGNCDYAMGFVKFDKNIKFDWRTKQNIFGVVMSVLSCFPMLIPQKPHTRSHFLD